MGRRALTAEEKAERQWQRQEALHAKHTLELVREHALDPHLRVIVDRVLPTSSASQATTATIDRPYANEDDSPVDPLARERHAASAPFKPPSLPGQSTVRQNRDSHSSPLIAKLSALGIGGDASTLSDASTHGPIDLSPVQAFMPALSPIRQNDEDDHSHDNDQNSPLQGGTDVSSSEDYSAAQPITRVYQHDHPVSELASPSSHTPNVRAWFTSSSAPSSLDPRDPVLDGFLRSIYQQAGDPFHVHRPRIHGVEMDGPCIHFHPFHGAGRYIIHPSTTGFRGMDRWKWEQGYGLVGGSLA